MPHEMIVPWDGEAERVAELMEKRGGEWAVAAAYRDYAYFSQTPTISELEEEDKIRAAVEDQARAMVKVIPPKQIGDVIKHCESLLDNTVGHYAVQALCSSLKLKEGQRPKKEPRAYYFAF